MTATPKNNTAEGTETSFFKSLIKDFDPDYEKVLIKIAERCNNLSHECFFVTQPSAYSYDITPKLKSLLWMTPPNEDYTLDLQSLIEIASTYNSALMKIATDNEINFCDLAKEIPPSEKYFYDDVHFNENDSTPTNVSESDQQNYKEYNGTTQNQQNQQNT